MKGAQLSLQELKEPGEARRRSSLPAKSSRLSNKVLLGDAFDLFEMLDARSIDLIITSPPYWGHREYGLNHNWELFNDIDAVKREFSRYSPGYATYRSRGGVLGLEPYPEWYVQHLAEILSRASVCLKLTGSMWINLGDTYFARWASIRENGRRGLADSARQRRKTPLGGICQEKQLLLLPARFAIAMQERGWILRNDLIWNKPNATPKPEGDRLNSAHEHFFHFVLKPKEGRASYYYDTSVLEPRRSDVVSVNVAPGEEGHTATFPRGLLTPRILSSSPPNGVVLDPFCGTGRALQVAQEFARQVIGFEKSPEFHSVAERKLESMLSPSSAPQKDTGNYISEWFGRRIYPTVRLADTRALTGANKLTCPFLTEVLSERTECWKGANSKGVCTISAVSNGFRQDWLACPHRVIHTDIIEQSLARIFGPTAAGRFPIPVSALRDEEKLFRFTQEVQSTGRGYLFFQDKLGGEISLSGTRKNPEMSFDVMLVEVVKDESTKYRVSRYGILELQTMDFHGSYKNAVSALTSALDLHGTGFPSILQSNLSWAGRNVEGPNIANVFKRTFYQMLVKFQLASGGAAAGTVLALPQAVWDSWQPFLGAPRLVATKSGYDELEECESSDLNAYICVFDIISNNGAKATQDESRTEQADISPVRVEKFIRLNPQTLAHQAFTAVPDGIRTSFADTDLILTTIKSRLALWWPAIAGTPAPRRSRTRPFI